MKPCQLTRINQFYASFRWHESTGFMEATCVSKWQESTSFMLASSDRNQPVSWKLDVRYINQFYWWFQPVLCKLEVARINQLYVKWSNRTAVSLTSQFGDINHPLHPNFLAVLSVTKLNPVIFQILANLLCAVWQ